MSNTPDQNWLPRINEISDRAVLEVVINARHSILGINDDDLLNQLLVKFDQLLNAEKSLSQPIWINDEDKPDDENHEPYDHILESDLEKTFRLEKLFEKNNLKLQEALALLVIRETRLGNYSAAIKAYEVYDTDFGRKVRTQRATFGKKSVAKQARQRKLNKQQFQLMEAEFRLANPNLSLRDIAQKIHEKLKRLPVDKRPCDLKSAETIRKIIAKPSD